MTDLSSWTAYFQDFGQFFNGFLFTLALAIGSFILAMVLGIFFGAMSTSKRPILRILARIFVEFYQNTPLLVQFVIVFYGLPLISDHIIMIPIYWTAVLCVGLYHGAYIAEVIRSGIQSIPSGQMEAALSQGFTYISAMRLIILPQTFRIILPQEVTMESILEILTPDNLVFIFKGFGLTLYISLIAIILSTIIGTVLAVMRNGKNPILRIISSIYIEFVRNVPNLLWIFTIFLVFKMKSTPAGITAFTLFTSAALAEIIRGGLNAVDKGQYEAGMSQGFTSAQILYYIILPQAIRKMLPAIISQFVTVIKDTSLLYSVIALQELFGASQILMGRYFEPEQVFSLYILIALIYFSFNLAISSLSHMLAKRWQQAAE
ncbi:ABC-type amino acid transporter, membrane-spanning permease [Streptococcus pneumoniae]|nr:ABC-type amino acid transporter, membrane-spanning permease [Streptococcus pneumoniae]